MDAISQSCDAIPIGVIQSFIYSFIHTTPNLSILSLIPKGLGANYLLFAGIIFHSMSVEIFLGVLNKGNTAPIGSV